jgi:hypothetical protein
MRRAIKFYEKKPPNKLKNIQVRSIYCKEKEKKPPDKTSIENELKKVIILVVSIKIRKHINKEN